MNLRFKSASMGADALSMKRKSYLETSKNSPPEPCNESSYRANMETRNSIPYVAPSALNFRRKPHSAPGVSCKRRWQQFEERMHINDAPVTTSCDFLHSSRQRVSTVFLSVMLCIALLIYMISLFSTKWQTVRSLGKQGEQLKISAPSGLSGGQVFHSERKVASTEASQAWMQIMKLFLSRIVDILHQNVDSMKLLPVLLKDQYGTLTANALRTFLQPKHARRGLLNAVPKPSEKGNSYTTIISIYGAGKGKKEAAPTPFLHSVRNSQLHQKEQPVTSEIPIQSKAHNGASNHLNLSQVQANALKSDALNPVGKLAPTSSSTSAGYKNRQRPGHSIRYSARQTVVQNSSQSINPPSGIQKDRPQGNGPKINQEMETAALSKGMIEIWILRSGNSLCRIYNAGRLLDGRLLLPLWMEKHSVVLLHQCGVKDPVFAIKSNNNDKAFIFNKTALSMTGEVRIIDKRNMDLFGSSAPRPHMPHFVTDILFPMVATELLKGTGSGVAKHACIRMRSSPNSLEVTRAAFSHLKPSLFLREETWQAKSSSWVRRLVNFFSHPAVGFTFLSEEDRSGPNRWVSYNKSNAVWRFRSVLSSNLNVYETEELFDTHGNNFVLYHNGLSGVPVWSINGISQQPCQVSITALTRTGPRALLNLDVLQKTVDALFVSGGLKLDFKVVKFEDAGFDTQVKTMQRTNILIATHGAGNANLIFLRRGATIIEVFPFAYRAGPFDGFARVFRLEYKKAMSAPQTKVFKECMNRYESDDNIRLKVFGWWDKAVSEEKKSPWVHRLELEKEFGEPNKPQGMATRRCVRMQQLAFDTKTVAAAAFESAKRQCNDWRFRSRPVHGR